MNGPTRSEIAENWTGPDYQDETDWTKCDKCDEEFDRETLHNHEDGNLYCDECNYMTEQDRIDGDADNMRDDAEER